MEKSVTTLKILAEKDNLPLAGQVLDAAVGDDPASGAPERNVTIAISRVFNPLNASSQHNS